jgi:hypothetical protein
MIVYPDTPLPPVPKGTYPYMGLTIQLDTKAHAEELVALINRRCENALLRALGHAFHQPEAGWLAEHAHESWMQAELEGVMTMRVVIGFLTDQLCEEYGALDTEVG